MSTPVTTDLPAVHKSITTQKTRVVNHVTTTLAWQKFLLRHSNSRSLWIFNGQLLHGRGNATNLGQQNVFNAATRK